jgi:hypothetical protein
MNVENSTIRSEIRELLEDGRWRNFHEVFESVWILIPPEQAARAWSDGSTARKSSKTSLEKKVESGRAKIIRQCLRTMPDVEKKTAGSRLSVRLKRTTPTAL